MTRQEFYANLNLYKSLQHAGTGNYGNYYQKIDDYYGTGKHRYFTKDEWDAYQREQNKSKFKTTEQAQKEGNKKSVETTYRMNQKDPEQARREGEQEAAFKTQRLNDAARSSEEGQAFKKHKEYAIERLKEAIKKPIYKTGSAIKPVTHRTFTTKVKGRDTDKEILGGKGVNSKDYEKIMNLASKKFGDLESYLYDDKNNFNTEHAEEVIKYLEGLDFIYDK